LGVDWGYKMTSIVTNSWQLQKLKDFANHASFLQKSLKNLHLGTHGNITEKI
jgi:hypothetical protein